MKLVLAIAADEQRYWLRSKLALSVFALFALVLIVVSLLKAVRMQAESAEREHDQSHAEQTFLSQPDRHPHRMVHYGHYVFRTPAPLALFDPGLDAVTGQSMFLEGHRQNTAMFSHSAASADLGGLSWITPAMIYQLFGPILIVLLGHGAIVREREAKTLAPLLAQGTSGPLLIAGKALALLSFVILLLVPLFASALLAISRGESLLTGLSLVGIYFLYLIIWAALTLFFSSVVRKRGSVLTGLTATWLSLTLVLPSIAVNLVTRFEPLAGKIETDLIMISEKRDLSDGHNVSETEFEQLSSSLFEQYGVDRVEDLEVNIRGIVSRNAEEQLTETMNLYAERRMDSELRQAKLVTRQGWLTPMLAVAAASRSISGTDLANYQRFLREAEVLRYEFVQGLNQVHIEQLDYTTDINRSRDEESSRKTRMDAANWQILEEFRFEPASASARFSNAVAPLTMLLCWTGLLTVLLFWISRRLKP